MGFPLSRRALARIVEGTSAAVFGCTLRYARHSVRWHLSGPLEEALASARPLIVSCWHQDLLLLCHYLLIRTAIQGRRRWVTLTSASFDGEIAARLLAPFGVEAVRGSSGKSDAVGALRGLERRILSGSSLLLVSDGPQPPPFRLRNGPVLLAQRTGVPLYLARGWARPQLLVPRSWFRLAVPLPRCHIAVFSEGPADVSGTLESARARAEERLMALCEAADAHLYLRPGPGRGVRLV